MGEALRVPQESSPPSWVGTALRPVPRPWGVRRAADDLVELVEVGKEFVSAAGGTIRALDGITLSVGAGSLCLVRGPSGSGKTTLLQLIAALKRPTRGRIRIDGCELTRLSEDRLAPLRRRAVGFVFQSPLLIPGASALANVMLPALPDPSWDGDLKPRARALLALVGLADRDREPVERLSGGERQRVGIARALLQDPRILLADEPTAHLDPEGSKEILDLLDEQRRGGRAVIVASHDPLLRESPRFDRVFDLRAGRVAAEERRR